MENHIIQKRKDPRLNMITITQPKAKILVDKAIDLAVGGLIGSFTVS